MNVAKVLNKRVDEFGALIRPVCFHGRVFAWGVKVAECVVPQACWDFYCVDSQHVTRVFQ